MLGAIGLKHIFFCHIFSYIFHHFPHVTWKRIITITKRQLLQQVAKIQPSKLQEEKRSRQNTYITTVLRIIRFFTVGYYCAFHSLQTITSERGQEPHWAEVCEILELMKLYGK